MNESFQRITGYSADEILGRNCRVLNESVPGQEQELDALRTLIRNGREGTVTLRNRRKDGRLFWNRLSLAPVLNYEDRITHIVGVMDDVTADKDSEEMTRITLSELEKTTAEKNLFARAIGHELRGPLSAASNWAELLELDPTSSNLAEGVSTIRQSLASMERLISDLSELHSVSDTHFELEMSRLDVSELLQRACHALRPGARARGIDIVESIPGRDCRIDGDSQRLNQVFGNVIGNAVKYSKAEGRVLVSLERTDGDCEIRVQDDGVGISPPELEAVGKPFFRGETGRPGLGLGLAIAKSIVERHSGSLDIDSAGRNRGAVVTIRLPGTDSAREDA